MELPPIITVGLYGGIALFNIISLGLLAYAVNSWRGYFYFDDRSSSPSSVNFMLFNTIWTFLALVYLAVVPRVAAALYISVVALGLLAVTTIFWFAGSIALAAYLGVFDCDGGGGFCGVYRASQAATAFGFFIWIMFTVLLAFEALRFFKRGVGGRDKADDPGTKMTTAQTEPQAASASASDVV